MKKIRVFIGMLFVRKEIESLEQRLNNWKDDFNTVSAENIDLSRDLRVTEMHYDDYKKNSVDLSGLANMIQNYMNSLNAGETLLIDRAGRVTVLRTDDNHKDLGDLFALVNAIRGVSHITPEEAIEILKSSGLGNYVLKEEK